LIEGENCDVNNVEHIDGDEDGDVRRRIPNNNDDNDDDY
jgi:hypothetical protein